MTEGSDAPPARRPTRLVLLFLTGTALFTAATCVAPLYYSNQNQYFLHGLASAGDGLLRADWLANTRDPTPVFTALVALTARHLPDWTFYVHYALLLGAYGSALAGLFFFLTEPRIAARRWPLFVALLFLVHSALVRWTSCRWLGDDYPWFFQCGVAGQYVLGGYLQPSVFGVLLIVAVYLFVRDRILLAAACAALAVIVHPTYVLPAALLALGFALAAGQVRRGLLAILVFLVLLAPTAIYVLTTFGPTNSGTMATAEGILIDLRIPHHTRVERWLDTTAALQMGWIVLALILVRRSRLFVVLAVPFAGGVVLTAIQAMAQTPSLALLFPWRVSAVLVPIATAILLSRLSALSLRVLDGAAVRLASLLLVLALAGFGIWITATGQAYQSGTEDLRLFDFVRRTREARDVYLVPVRVLRSNSRGSLSTDFQSLAQRRRDGRGIPIDLQRFRLSTGTPIYVDFKAIPYRDVEVIEWRERLEFSETVEDLLAGGPLGQSLARALLRPRGITHVVLPATAPKLGAAFEMTYDDGVYRVYRLTPGRSTSPASDR